MLGFGKLARAAFGSSNDRKIKNIQPIVNKINSLEAVSYTHLTLPTILLV